MGTRETRIAKLERMAAGANPANCPGVMTPEEWSALERGEFSWPSGSPPSGVFVLPGVITEEEWERAAKEQQGKLTGAPHDD